MNIRFVVSVLLVVGVAIAVFATQFPDVRSAPDSSSHSIDSAANGCRKVCGDQGLGYSVFEECLPRAYGEVPACGLVCEGFINEGGGENEGGEPQPGITPCRLVDCQCGPFE